MNRCALNFLLPLFLLGCCGKSQPVSSEPSFRPLQNGFGVVVRPIGIDTGPGAKLYYKGGNKNPVLVWPFIGTRGFPILYTNDIALLLADKPNSQGHLGNAALVVDQGVGPAMDISKDVLKIAAEQNGVDFGRALKACRPSQLHQTRDSIKVLFLADQLIDRSLPDLEASISWDQIFQIIRDVRTSGRSARLVNSDVIYLEKDYSP